MEMKIRRSGSTYRTNFVEEFNNIANKFDEKFAEIVKNGSIKRYYNSVMLKYELSDSDLSYTSITDYLIENKNGKVQIGDKHYYFPPYMFEIMNDLVKRIVNIECEESFKKSQSQLIGKAPKDSYSDFRIKYYTKLKQNLSILRQDSTMFKDEFGRLFVAPDKDKEEFKLRQIRGAILMACIDFAKIYIDTTLNK